VTYRLTGHSRRDHRQYQPEDEKQKALANEPIGRFAAHLTKAGIADAAALDAIRDEVKAEIEEAVRTAMSLPIPSRKTPWRTFSYERRKAEHRRGPAGGPYGRDAERPPGVLHWRGHRDLRRVGGAFTVTYGLEKEFKDRLIDTPISEAGFFGVALGAAIMA